MYDTNLEKWDTVWDIKTCFMAFAIEVISL